MTSTLQPDQLGSQAGRRSLPVGHIDSLERRGSCPRRTRAPRSPCAERVDAVAGVADQGVRARKQTRYHLPAGAAPRRRAARRGARQPGAEECPPVHHSITWSARCSSDGGIFRPRALAVFEVDDELELRGLLDGQVAGLGAFRILSTYAAARGNCARARAIDMRPPASGYPYAVPSPAGGAWPQAPRGVSAMAEIASGGDGARARSLAIAVKAPSNSSGPRTSRTELQAQWPCRALRGLRGVLASRGSPVSRGPPPRRPGDLFE